MMKELIRSAVAGAYRASFALALRESQLRSNLCILCYHRVVPAEIKDTYFIPDLAVTPEAFRAQCKTLARYYTVLPLREAYAAWVNNKPVNKPIAVITFDDGYRDNHSFAAPILAEFGLRATFFVVADLVGTQTPPWYDRMGRAVQLLQSQGRGVTRDGAAIMVDGPGTISPREAVALAKARSPYDRAFITDALVAAAGVDLGFSSNDLIMTWEQLRSLRAQGHEIGSHSSTHEILPLLDDDALRYEVCQSKVTLEAGLDESVNTFCYPNGDFDARTKALTSKASYSCAVTTRRGTNKPGEPPYELRRWFIHEGRLIGAAGHTSATLTRLELSGLADRAFRRQNEVSVKS